MRIFAKQTNYRNERLLALAKECPRCMSCGDFNAGDVVAAHSNSQRMGKGIGLKAHDIPAYLCGDCHAIVDGRMESIIHNRESRERMWADAVVQTWLWLMQEGMLEISSRGLRG